MTARDELFRRVAGAFIDEDRANALLDAYRAEVGEEFAAAVVSDVSLQGPYMDVILHRVADLIRRMAPPTTTQEQ